MGTASPGDRSDSSGTSRYRNIGSGADFGLTVSSTVLVSAALFSSASPRVAGPARAKMAARKGATLQDVTRRSPLVKKHLRTTTDRARNVRAQRDFRGCLLGGRDVSP